MDMEELAAVVIAQMKEKKYHTSLNPFEMIIRAMEQIDRFLHLESFEKEALLVIVMDQLTKDGGNKHVRYFLDHSLISYIAKCVIKVTNRTYDINTMRKSRARTLFCWRK